MYAIINKKTKKYLCGTDYNYTIKTNDNRYIHKQLTSFNKCLTYESERSAKMDLLHRRTGKDYKIVKIRVSLVLPYKYGIEGR
jgi:hypothetical protein